MFQELRKPFNSLIQDNLIFFSQTGAHQMLWAFIEVL